MRSILLPTPGQAALWPTALRLAVVVLIPVVAVSGNAAPAETPQARVPADLHVSVKSADTGQPVPCTVTLIDATGRVVTEGEGLRTGFRSTGEFTRSLPPGRTRLRVTRGPEFKAVEKDVSLAPGRVTEVPLELERFVNLRQRGWFAGDNHVHMIHGERTIPVDFDQVALAARAEDLQYLSLAQAWNIDRSTPERLEAELARRSMPDCRLTWNLEAPKNYFKGDAGRCLGHCWTLALRGRTAEGADVIRTLLEASAADYESRKPSVANFEVHAFIQAQGGSVFYTHPARWWTGPWGGQGGYQKQEKMRVSNMAVELPLDTLVGPTFDGLDVITGAGEFAADQKSFQLWALLLNHGYRVAATASSDACFDRPGGATPGTARVYAFLDGPFSLPAVSQAIKRGRTFVTTGPLLVVSVDGQPPGSAFTADGTTHRMTIEAWSSGSQTGGLKRVEILRNGELFETHRLNGTLTTFETNRVIRDSSNAWYCVRLFGANEQRQRAISGAFFLDAQPWQAPNPVPANVHVRVTDAESGQPLDAVLTEVNALVTSPAPARTRRVNDGEATVSIAGTSRLRAEVKGYEAVTLSPLFDFPPLIEMVTRLDDQALPDWRTFERMRDLLGKVSLHFRMNKAVQAR